METGKFVTKTADFAANVIPDVGMYSNARPSDLLKVVMQAEAEAGSLDFSQATVEKMLRFMPDRMVGMKADSHGALEFSVYKKADFLAPTGPAGTTIKGSGVVDILVADTIMEGAMPYTAARNVLETWRISGAAEHIPFFSARKAAKSIAPNADAADLAQSIGSVLATPDTYKLLCSLDKGLLADSSIDIKAQAIREMGAAMEIALEQTAVKEVLANASETTVSAAEADALKGLNFGRAKVGVNGFRASGALIDPMFEAHALNSMAIPAYNETAQGIGNEASLVKFAGLTLGVTGADGLDWGTSGKVGAVVVDKSHASHIIIREDLSLSDYDNVTKYLLQPTVVSRFCAVSPVSDKKGDNKGAMVKVVQS